LKQHFAHTNSSVAKFILSDFDSELKRFVKVFPKDYKRALAAKMQNEKLSS
jgi:glutamate synthase (NADPH/NADH) large chain